MGPELRSPRTDRDVRFKDLEFERLSPKALNFPEVLNHKGCTEPGAGFPLIVKGLPRAQFPLRARNELGVWDVSESELLEGGFTSFQRLTLVGILCAMLWDVGHGRCSGDPRSSAPHPVPTRRRPTKGFPLHPAVISRMNRNLTALHSGMRAL